MRGLSGKTEEEQQKAERDRGREKEREPFSKLIQKRERVKMDLETTQIPKLRKVLKRFLEERKINHCIVLPSL